MGVGGAGAGAGVGLSAYSSFSNGQFLRVSSRVQSQSLSGELHLLISFYHLVFVWYFLPRAGCPLMFHRDGSVVPQLVGFLSEHRVLLRPWWNQRLARAVAVGECVAPPQEGLPTQSPWWKWFLLGQVSHTLTHSLVASCMCPDQGSNLQPWCTGTTLYPPEPPGQGPALFLLQLMVSDVKGHFYN